MAAFSGFTAGKAHRVNMEVCTPNQVNTMQLKTILNRIQKHSGFVFDSARLVESREGIQIRVCIRERRGSDPVCSGCGRENARRMIDRGLACTNSCRCGPSQCSFCTLHDAAIAPIAA